MFRRSRKECEVAVSGQSLLCKYLATGVQLTARKLSVWKSPQGHIQKYLKKIHQKLIKDGNTPHINTP